MAGTIMLSSCTGASIKKSAETSSEIVNESDSEIENIGKDSDAIGIQVTNPWRDVTAEEVHAVRIFTIPEGAQNVKWSIGGCKDADSSLIQAKFKFRGHEFTARIQYEAPENTDISGMYYKWTATGEGKLATWGDGNVDAKFYRYNGDESVALCTWYDIEMGIAYSLSTVAKNLDDFDIQAVVELMVPKEQKNNLEVF